MISVTGNPGNPARCQCRIFGAFGHVFYLAKQITHGHIKNYLFIHKLKFLSIVYKWAEHWVVQMYPPHASIIYLLNLSPLLCLYLYLFRTTPTSHVLNGSIGDQWLGYSASGCEFEFAPQGFEKWWVEAASWILVGQQVSPCAWTWTFMEPVSRVGVPCTRYCYSHTFQIHTARNSLEVWQLRWLALTVVASLLINGSNEINKIRIVTHNAVTNEISV